MNLNNMCTAAFVGLSIHYMRFKKQYDEMGIEMNFDINPFSELIGHYIHIVTHNGKKEILKGDEIRTDPYAIRIVICTKNTSRGVPYFISKCFSEDELKALPSDFLIDQMHAAVLQVQTMQRLGKYNKETFNMKNKNTLYEKETK